ncbi:hypothetical protein ACHQM5_016384 [Ranunculus cassubicifolius]
MPLASSIFRQIPHPNSFLYTAMIRGFSQNGSHDQSVMFFVEMNRQGIGANYLTYPFVLKACSSLRVLVVGEQVHCHIVKSGFLWDIYVLNGVLDLYVKCGCVGNARKLYDEMPERDVVSYTSMISGYFSVGDLSSARDVFEQVEEADVVLWSAMIAGYAQNEAPDEAVELFRRMQSVGVKPNSITMVSVVSACAQLGDYKMGRWAHEFMVNSGMQMNSIVWSSLMDMYIKSGFIDEALGIFRKVQGRDVVCWNSLINGYAKNGFANEALEVFREMQDAGMVPNSVTYVSVLSACAQLGILQKGREMEYSLMQLGIGVDLSVGTALLDMYMKCGSLVDAYRIFSGIYPRDVVTWSAMINGYATNGHFKGAMALFGGLLKDGIMPNDVTFMALLIACSHGGLIREGYEFFSSMTRDYGIIPKMEHYACMVDLLGRAGQVEEAKRFIDTMPIEPGISIWGSLLGSCTTYNNSEIGEFAARQLAKLNPANDGNYVPLSNIYAATNRWDDVEITRTSMKHNIAHKSPGCSWIEAGE